MSKTHRSLIFEIVHRNDQRSRVSPYDWFPNIKTGNLIQTADQIRYEKTTAYVLPGLIAYKDQKSGDRLMFEIAARVTREEIEVQLVNQFSSNLLARLQLRPGFDKMNEAAQLREVGQLASLVARRMIRERQAQSVRSGKLRSQWWLWVAHLLKFGYISPNEVRSRSCQLEPIVLGEPLINGDPDTAYAIYR